MSTSTLSFCWSPFTSTISPSKSESGPEVTFTDSPSVNCTCVLGRSPTAVPVWMTYQRNIERPLLPEEDVLDDALPDQVVGVEVHPDDQAGDQHDRRPLDHLRLARPLDLLDLAPRLGDEAAGASARGAALP